MPFRHSRLVLVAGALLAVGTLLCLGLRIVSLRSHDWERVQERVQRMGGADAIIDAVTHMKSTQDGAGSPPVIIRPNTPHWPKVFSNGSVEEVQIRKDCVLLDLGRRMFLLVFEDRASGYGTRMISDRLWYWGGEESGLRKRDSEPK
jgi:hypothetical protein